MSGSSRTAAVVVLCLAVLASQATASLSDFNLFHHQRASLRKLKASTESKTVLYDLDVVDRCTFKQDFSSGKLGSCIPNQLYVLAKANATADYGEADRFLLQETAGQLRCLSYGPGAKCAADSQCTDFLSYCGFTPVSEPYDPETNATLYTVADVEHRLGVCRPTVQSEAECKKENNNCMWGKESPNGMNICLAMSRELRHYYAYQLAGSELAPLLLGLWKHCAAVVPTEVGSCAAGGQSKVSLKGSEYGKMNLTTTTSSVDATAVIAVGGGMDTAIGQVKSLNGSDNPSDASANTTTTTATTSNGVAAVSGSSFGAVLLALLAVALL